MSIRNVFCFKWIKLLFLNLSLESLLYRNKTFLAPCSLYAVSRCMCIWRLLEILLHYILTSKVHLFKYVYANMEGRGGYFCLPYNDYDHEQWLKAPFEHFVHAQHHGKQKFFQIHCLQLEFVGEKCGPNLKGILHVEPSNDPSKKNFTHHKFCCYPSSIQSLSIKVLANIC